MSSQLRYVLFSRSFSLLLLALCGLPPAAAADALQQAVQDGKQLFMQESFGGKGMHCNSCHRGGGLEPGRLPNGQTIPSLSNAATIFPRFNPRQGRVLTLQDQVHNCVQGALQGTPPVPGSPRMAALISYLTSLSEGKSIHMGGKPQ